MVAKCGDHRIHHWSHRAICNCDRWWETETEWHRGWKNHFPTEWQEVIRRAEDGEKHIADILTAGGMVMEFQHSALRREEREARESFYKKMTWIVDGRRRVHDRARFSECLRTASFALPNPLTLEIRHTQGALLRDWASSGAGVFFDFGDASEENDHLRFDTPILWRVMPDNATGGVYVSPCRESGLHPRVSQSTPLGGFNSPAAAQSIAEATQRSGRSIGHCPEVFSTIWPGEERGVRVFSNASRTCEGWGPSGWRHALTGLCDVRCASATSAMIWRPSGPQAWMFQGLKPVGRISEA